MEPEIEEFDDPYLGLRLQAHHVQQIQNLAIRRRILLARLPPIAGGAPGIWDDIAAFLRNLLGFFDIAQYFQRLYDNIVAPFLNAIREGILNRLHNLFGPILENIRTVISTWLGNIHTRLRDLWQAITTSLRAIPERIWELTREIITSIRDKIIAFAGALTERLRKNIELLRGFFTALKEGLRERITAFISRMIEQATLLRQRISEQVTILWQRLRESTTALRERIFKAIRAGFNDLIRGLKRRFLEVWNLVVGGIRLWWRNSYPQFRDAAERVLTFAKPHVRRWVGEFQKLPAAFLEWAARSAGTNLALNPSRALGTVGTLYSMALAAGSAAMITASVLNLIPATNWVGLSQFAAYISEAAGFEPITKASYGVLLNDALAWPLRYHWNQQLRPKIPTEGSIFLMGRKRGLDFAEFQQAMAFQGLPNQWIRKIYDFFWTDPSPYWLLRMSEHATPALRPTGMRRQWLDKWLPGWQTDPWAWFKAKLMLAGYEDMDIPAFIEGFEARRLGPPLTQFKTSVRAMIREAYWTEEQATAVLRSQKVRENEIRLLYMAEELDYQNRYLDEQTRLYRDEFRKETLTEDELRILLSSYIVRPERVEQIVAREEIRKLPKPRPPKAPKDDPMLAKIRAEKVRSHTAMFRKRIIDPPRLYNYLLADGLSEPLARATTITEAARRIKMPPLDSPYFQLDAFRDLINQGIIDYDDKFMEGEITVKQYLFFLRNMGVDPDLATYLADRLELRQFIRNLTGVAVG